MFKSQMVAVAFLVVLLAVRISANEAQNKPEDESMIVQSAESLLSVPSVPQDLKDEMDLTLCQTVQKMGYPCEEHHVTTEDYCILTMFRIPHGKLSNVPGKKVAFLQHGLMDSAFTWVTNFPHQSLPYILADRGYDVWLGNVRGNHFSMGSEKWTSSLPFEYWQFTYEEMITIDLPTMVRHALSVSDPDDGKLVYIGHSQGGIMGFLSLSFGKMKTELASKMKLFIGLAPATSVANATGLIQEVAKQGYLIDKLVNILGAGHLESRPNNEVANWLLDVTCYAAQEFCNNLLTQVAGAPNHVNSTRLPLILHQSAQWGGTSLKDFLMYVQNINTGRWARFDYNRGGAVNIVGEKKTNENQYGQSEAPLWNISYDRVPTAVLYSKGDILVTPTDTEEQLARGHIGKLIARKRYKNYSHLGFTWSSDDIHECMANKEMTCVYKDVLTVLDACDPKCPTYTEGMNLLKDEE